MQSCCLTGCESYKYISKQKIGYFKFPLHDNELLLKWLNQIRLPNWVPTETHQICSTHFHVDDIDYSYQYPVLKKNAVPMIFPLKHFQSISNYRPFIAPVLKSEKKLPIIKTKTNSKFSKSCVERSVQRPSPVILLYTEPQSTSVCTNQINQLDFANLDVRKVPLKVDEGSDTVNSNDINSYILIVSDAKKNGNSSWDNELLQNKQPILRVQIDRKINDTSGYIVNNYTRVHNKLEKKNCTSNHCLSQKVYSEEIEVDDATTTTKIVVFKYNPYTKKIKVYKKNNPLAAEDDVATEFNSEESFPSNNIDSDYESKNEINEVSNRHHNIKIITRNQQDCDDSEIINVISDNDESVKFSIDVTEKSSNQKAATTNSKLNLKVNETEVQKKTDTPKLEQKKVVIAAGKRIAMNNPDCSDEILRNSIKKVRKESE